MPFGAFDRDIGIQSGTPSMDQKLKADERASAVCCGLAAAAT
jgi:hypothetical protein